MSKLTPFIVFSLLVASCTVKDVPENQYQNINGEAQGTTYSIVLDSAGVGIIEKTKIDSIFEQIDASLSIWKPSSVINKFNGSDSINISDSHFINVYYRSIEIGEMSKGGFNFQNCSVSGCLGFWKDEYKANFKTQP